jgi:phospholipase C
MTSRFIRNALPGALLLGQPALAAEPPAATPVKHVIVIYGENRSFDHLFATYRSPSGETVRNLLSEGIVNDDGSPGPNFRKAAQFRAANTETYTPHPLKGAVYITLPPPLAGGREAPADAKGAPFETVEAAAKVTSALLREDLRLMTVGATGLKPKTVDTRIRNAEHLPGGPFQLTPGVPYESYSANPVHRFYQAVQQADCDAATATPANPSGCANDLYAWVEVTTGTGGDGKPRPDGFNDRTTGEGAAAMGFYNVQQGDMPDFTALANEYTLADNYHQPAWGGTGLSSIIAGFGDAIWYAGPDGNPAKPPATQIENPNPQPGTDNYYIQDGYKSGSYTACADSTQPGVAPILRYLAALTKPVPAKCEPGHYYLLNNYRPGYLADGTKDTTHAFAIPPVPVRSIGDVMLDAGLSFAWFGENWNRAKPEYDPAANSYCDLCNPFHYQTSIMTSAAIRRSAIRDTADFYDGLSAGTLPAVSFLKPGGMLDGHPVSSTFPLFEAFVRKVLVELKKNPELWNNTAVFVTVDEAGGYYDSGYIQPLDFFGDGPRIPLLIVSPWTRGGHIAHQYSDHVSILKFIEANWQLPRISNRSRDNLPNPIQKPDRPYVPVNGPAIGDLMAAFRF